LDQVCTYIGIIVPVSERGLHINQLFTFLSYDLAFIIYNQTAHFVVFTIFKVILVSKVHKNIIKGFSSKVNPSFLKLSLSSPSFESISKACCVTFLIIASTDSACVSLASSDDRLALLLWYSSRVIFSNSSYFQRLSYSYLCTL